ncbi:MULTISPECIES: ATP-binding protein [Microbacterium]|uniref:ATP-binding protein n=1 Tax=Microbacterium marmarense TaxID=3122051 RepID=A0ABU8LRF1_9MICO
MPTERTEHVCGRVGADLTDRVLDALAALWESGPPVPAEDREPFALAVSEIAANIVEHASAREPVHVSLTLTMTETMLEAVFTDTADPALIDLSSIQMPDWHAESGRGLALALATLDELVHETHEGNTWRLRRVVRGVV